MTPTHSEAMEKEGKSIAAWTGVSVICLGSLLGCIAVGINSKWLFAVGCVVIVLGVASGKVLAMMGLGVYGSDGRPRDGHDGPAAAATDPSAHASADSSPVTPVDVPAAPADQAAHGH